MKTKGKSKLGPLKSGAAREDGFIFHSYYRRNSRTYEKWLSAASYHAKKVYTTLEHARVRAREKNVPFNIDAAYLISIFPEDSKCPALGIPLTWGGDLFNSPSLDRIEPTKGYVQGNVQWLSNKANTIKTNATTAEICAVADFLKKEIDYR